MSPAQTDTLPTDDFAKTSIGFNQGESKLAVKYSCSFVSQDHRLPVQFIYSAAFKSGHFQNSPKVNKKCTKKMLKIQSETQMVPEKGHRA